MGNENNILKRKSKSLSGIKMFKRNNRNKTTETTENKKVPNILDNFQGEEDTLEARPQSKTVRINPNKKPLEESPYKTKLGSIQKLKSLSTQNLVKIEKNHNLEEALTDSLDTNCCSNKSKEEDNKNLIHNHRLS